MHKKQKQGRVVKMRIRVTFFPVFNFPLSYHAAFYSFLKGAIRRGEERIYQKLFKENSRDIKPLTTAVRIEHPTIKNYMIVQHHGLKFYLSASEEISLAFLKGISRLKALCFFDQVLKPARIEILEERDLTSGDLFYTLSPIVLVEKGGKGTIPVTDYPYWHKALLHHVSRVLKNEITTKDLRITPVNVRKVVFRFNLNGYLKYLDGAAGLFKIEGEKEIIKLLYKQGIGARKPYGCGMIEKYEGKIKGDIYAAELFRRH